MARAFYRGVSGIIGHLEPAERSLLRGLLADVAELLDVHDPHEDPLAALVGIDPGAEPPEDPAVRRLLPDAVRGDDEAALQFRRLTERGLREGKAGRLRAAALGLEGKGRLALDDAAARNLSMALNDVRLVLSERLGIRTEEDAARVHGMVDWAQARDDASYMAVVYNFVSWLQDSLTQAMLRGLAKEHRGPDAVDPGRAV